MLRLKNHIESLLWFSVFHVLYACMDYYNTDNLLSAVVHSVGSCALFSRTHFNCLIQFCCCCNYFDCRTYINVYIFNRQKNIFYKSISKASANYEHIVYLTQCLKSQKCAMVCKCAENFARLAFSLFHLPTSVFT